MITFPLPNRLCEKSSTLSVLLVSIALKISTPPNPLIEFQCKYNSSKFSFDSIISFILGCDAFVIRFLEILRDSTERLRPIALQSSLISVSPNWLSSRLSICILLSIQHVIYLQAWSGNICKIDSIPFFPIELVLNSSFLAYLIIRGIN